MAFIDDYFARIGFRGEARADYATLKQLHLLHTCHIPFENLDVLLERPILLDDAHLADKLLSARRGGYCYEQNGVFTRALRELGFAVQDLGARVVLANPPEMPPRTHRLSLITLDDAQWLADVGFGGQTLSTPIAFIPDAVQNTPHGSYRLIRNDDDYSLETRNDEGWQALYRFDLAHQYPADYLMANHFVSRWPDSHFRHHLLLALMRPDGGKITLLNRRVTRRVPGYPAATEELPNADALYDCLVEECGLALSHPVHGVSREALRAVMARLEQS